MGMDVLEEGSDADKTLRILVAAGANIEYQTKSKKELVNPKNFDASSGARSRIINSFAERAKVREEAHHKLREAVEAHQLETAKYALGDGARIRGYYIRNGEKVRELYCGEQNILHIAAINGNVDFIKFAINPLNLAKEQAGHEFIRSCFNPLTTDEINEKDAAGKTALDYALEFGHDRVADLLIERVPQIAITDENRQKTTPIHLALESKRFDAFNFFMKNCSDAELNQKDAEGRTPLRLAMDLELLEIADALSKRVPEVKRKSATYKTEFQKAVASDRSDLVYYLLYGARRNERIPNEAIARVIGTRNGNGDNSFHIAARLGHAKVLKILVDFCPPYTKEYINDRNVLPYNFALQTLGEKAVVNLNKKADKEFKKYGIAKRKQTVAHETAMHLAARYDHPDCIQVLIAAGAKTFVYDEDGYTPWKRYKLKGKSLSTEQQRVRELLKENRRFQ